MNENNRMKINKENELTKMILTEQVAMEHFTQTVVEICRVTESYQ